jgi:chromosome segregation ATPase
VLARDLLRGAMSDDRRNVCTVDALKWHSTEEDRPATMPADHPLADPAKLREEAAAWRLTSDDEGDCFEELARILEAAAARIESAEARIAELTEKLREMTARAAAHSYTAEMAEGGEEITRQVLARERADHAETRKDLDFILIERNSLQVERDALAKQLEKATAALQEIFDGPPETWGEWYEKHKAIINKDHSQ